MAKTIIKDTEFVLGEAMVRMYKIEDGKTLPVSVKSRMYEPVQYGWFYTPTREPYLKVLSQILDDFLAREEYKECYNYITDLNLEQVLKRLQNFNDEFNDEYEFFWNLMINLYGVFKKKVYDLLVDNGVAESYEEIEELRFYYGNRLKQSLPKPETEDERRNLVTFLISHIVICNNFKDLFGTNLIPSLNFLECNRLNCNIYENIVVPKDLATQVLYVVSSPDLYLMNEWGHLFGVSDVEEKLQEIKRILNHLEETYSPAVRTLEASRFREETIRGYIVDVLNATHTDGTPKNNTIQRVFYLMRRGAGEDLIKEFELNYSNKSIFRSVLEGTLIAWWNMYNNKQLTSISQVNNKVSNVMSRVKGEGLNIELVSNRVVSPYKQRLILANNGEPLHVFERVINDINYALSYKVTISNGGMTYNDTPIKNGLVRILDILIHP